MRFNKKEQQFVIDLLLEKTYEYIEENNINYKEINKKNESWGALCTIQGPNKYITYNNHIKKGFEYFKKVSKPFVIIHEIGHYFDTVYENLKETGKIKNEEIERIADEFIFKFCDEHLTTIEFFVVDNFITSFSKLKRIYRKEELEEINEQIEIFRRRIKETG